VREFILSTRDLLHMGRCLHTKQVKQVQCRETIKKNVKYRAIEGTGLYRSIIVMTVS
jgi:hypothetical protein